MALYLECVCAWCGFVNALNAEMPQTTILKPDETIPVIFDKSWSVIIIIVFFIL